jgi:Rab GDP dissociation inhibitor
MMVSSLHSVCQKGFYIAIISTNVETNNPENEIKAALDVIGVVKEKFITVSDCWLPKSDNDMTSGLYISNSMTPSSHFELETENVLALYR